MSKKAIVVVGPTASGKTSLGIHICKEFSGEVISCAKLKLKKTELKGKISDAYKELGEAVYTGTKAENDISEKVGFIIRKIDDLKEEFAECNEALDNLKEQ